MRTYTAENAVELHSTNNTELQYNAEERTPVGTYAAENAAELPSKNNTELQWNTRMKEIPRYNTEGFYASKDPKSYVENCKEQAFV